jgi:hypothetical protein
MEMIEVADQGHAPLLEGDIVHRIVHFVESCEVTRSAAPTKTE